MAQNTVPVQFHTGETISALEQLVEKVERESTSMRCVLHAGHGGRHLFVESTATPILGECEARNG